MPEIKTTEYGFVVQREVLHLTRDLFEDWEYNYDLELWFEDRGFKLRLDIKGKNTWSSEDDIEQFTGVTFERKYHDSEDDLYSLANYHSADFGDYIIFKENGTVEVMNAEEFAASGAVRVTG